MSELLKRAQKVLAIQDVYVREAAASVHPDFDPLIVAATPGLTMSVQVRATCSPDIKVKTHSLTSGVNQSDAEFVIDTGLRLLRAGVDVHKQDPSRDEILSEITAKFVARYVIDTKLEGSPSQELLRSFADNSIHHVWPYWREFLQATSARLRLPPVVLPMRVVHTVIATNAAVPNANPQ